MDLAGGHLTNVLTTSAAAAGAGIVLGGLVAGLTGIVFSSDREELDFKVRKAGYIGGAAGFTALLLDILVG